MTTSAHAVLTDYSGGDRGEGLDPDAVQLAASRFLVDLDKVYPGALARRSVARATSWRTSSTGRPTR
jgi:monoamine oxidase